MKYIITEDLGVCVFSNSSVHKDMAYALKVRNSIIGAGFITVSDDGEVRCHGESVSLKIKSRGELDAEIIGKQLLGY